MKDSSRRSNSVFHSRENLWSDAENDSSSDNEEKNIKSDPSNNDSFPLSSCCLICSILPNLSHINTCSNHLQLLHRSSLRPTQVVYMMHPPISQCPCQRKSKHRRRSMSSSESESRSRRKKRAMTIQSSSASSQDEQFFSPIHPSQPQLDPLNNARLSPSLPPSTAIQTHRNYPELLIPSVLERTTKEMNEEISPDVIELEAISSTLPEISPDQIVHVKDENEFLMVDDQNETRMNMAQATEQMFHHQYPQPIILLERIRLENYR